MRNQELQNKSLIMKWLWRYNQEDHALWKEVIFHIYGHEEQWCTNEAITTYGVGVWRSIGNLWLILNANTKVKVGRWDRISFWKENWNDHGTVLAMLVYFE